MLLKEFQRLKEIENNRYNIEWSTKKDFEQSQLPHSN